MQLDLTDFGKPAASFPGSGKLSLHAYGDGWVLMFGVEDEQGEPFDLVLALSAEVPGVRNVPTRLVRGALGRGTCMHIDMPLIARPKPLLQPPSLANGALVIDGEGQAFIATVGGGHGLGFHRTYSLETGRAAHPAEPFLTIPAWELAYLDAAGEVQVIAAFGRSGQ